MGRAVELPLTFPGHSARVVVTPCADGGWDVRTEVDDRTLGCEHYVRWPQVERFHARMQEWVNTAQHAEDRRQPRHLVPVTEDHSHIC